MMVFFVLFISLIIVQRLIEHSIAKRNEKWLIKKGGVEYNNSRYKIFTYLSLFFYSLITIELMFNQFQIVKPNLLLIILFFVIQSVRIWCVRALGRFWTRKKIVLPKVAVLRKGPYKYFKQPYDLIVGLEFVLISLIFGTYVTVAIFPLIYIIVLTIQTPLEKRLLGRL